MVATAALSNLEHYWTLIDQGCNQFTVEKVMIFRLFAASSLHRSLAILWYKAGACTL